MTKEEFEGLGITDSDLISIKHYKKNGIYVFESVGYICFYSSAGKHINLAFEKVKSEPLYPIHNTSDIPLNEILSIEIIKKDFWA